MEQPQIQEEEIDLIELFNALWAERLKVVKYGVIAGIIGIVVAYSIPNVYTVTAEMVPEMEAGSSSSGSLGSLASLAGINIGGESIGITAGTYPKIVTSTPFIFEFASMPVQLEDENREITLIEYFTEETKVPWWSHIMSAPMKALGAVMSIFREKDDKEMKSDINNIDIKKLSREQDQYKRMFSEVVSLSMDSKSLTMSLSVETQSPEVSLMLADEILVKLQEYMTLYKTSKTRNELASNQSMLNEAQAKYFRADSIYAAASDRTRNVISNMARISLDRLENEKNMTYQIYNQIAAQVELNKTKLNAETPILTVIEPASLPIKASSPNKPMVVIAFGFLGGIIAMVPTLISVLLGKKEEEESVA